MKKIVDFFIFLLILFLPIISWLTESYIWLYVIAFAFLIPLILIVLNKSSSYLDRKNDEKAQLLYLENTGKLACEKAGLKFELWNNFSQTEKENLINIYKNLNLLENKLLNRFLNERQEKIYKKELSNLKKDKGIDISKELPKLQTKTRKEVVKEWESNSFNQKYKILKDYEKALILKDINKNKKIEEEKQKLSEENKARLIKEAEIEKERLKNIEDEKNRLKKIEQEEKRKQVIEERKTKHINDIKENYKRKILENEERKKIQEEAIQELLDAGLIDYNNYSGKNIRESIPTDVKIAVWERDKQRCVNCYSNINLEFDHIIPVSKGGANTTKNIQLLCMTCNRKKSNKIL